MKGNGPEYMKSGTSECLCDLNGVPTLYYCAYYAQCSAYPNVKYIVTGHIATELQGRSERGQAVLQKDNTSQKRINAFRRATDAVHYQNSKCCFLAQLSHSGRQSPLFMRSPRRPGLSRVRGAFGVFRAPNVTDFEPFYQMFLDSISMARDSGFDGFYLHAAHGYLVWDLIEHNYYDRLLSVMRKSREMWPAAVISIKVDARHVSRAVENAGSQDTQKLDNFAAILAICDVIEISTGTYSTPNHIISLGNAGIEYKLYAAHLIKSGEFWRKFTYRNMRDDIKLEPLYKHENHIQDEDLQNGAEPDHYFIHRETPPPIQPYDDINSYTESELADSYYKKRGDYDSSFRASIKQYQVEPYKCQTRLPEGHLPLVALTSGFYTFYYGEEAYNEGKCDIPAFGRLMCIPGNERLVRLQLKGFQGTIVRAIGRILPLANAGPHTVWYQQNIQEWANTAVQRYGETALRAETPMRTDLPRYPKFILTWWIHTLLCWAFGFAKVIQK